MAMSEKDMPRQQSPQYLLFILFVSVFSLLLLGASVLLKPSPSVRTVIDFTDTLVCGLFFLDFVWTLVRSKNRWHYLCTWGWLDLISSIPLIPAFRVGRLARVVRIIRVLRGIRSVRILTRFILERRGQSAIMAAALVTVTMVAFGSIAILQFENVPESNIKGAEDAIWWSVVTLTTVGYGDRYPVTMEGRIIAAVLMVTGVGLFGALSGFVASWFLAPTEKEREDDIVELRREIRELREAIVQQGQKERK